MKHRSNKCACMYAVQSTQIETAKPFKVSKLTALFHWVHLMAIRSVERGLSFWMDLMLPTDQFSQSHYVDSIETYSIWLMTPTVCTLFGCSLQMKSYSFRLRYFDWTTRWWFCTLVYIQFSRHISSRHCEFCQEDMTCPIEKVTLTVWEENRYVCLRFHCIAVSHTVCEMDLMASIFFKKKNKTECCSLRMSAKKCDIRAI